MTYYSKHVFVCTNQKMADKKCCAASGGEAAFEHIKSKLLEQDLHGPGKIRVSKSGCLGRCSSGPCVAVYPEGLWYTYSSTEDLEQFIEGQLLHDQPVDHLLIDKKS